MSDPTWLPDEVLIRILKGTIFQKQRPSYQSHANRTYKISNNSRTIFKAKCLQTMCAHVSNLLLTCTRWHAVLTGYEKGNWLNIVAKRIYVYCFPKVALSRRNWWTQCASKVMEFSKQTETTYWHSSNKKNVKYGWKDIEIVLSDEMDYDPVLDTPEKVTQRKLAVKKRLFSQTVKEDVDVLPLEPPQKKPKH